jgi:hypothetical protein
MIMDIIATLSITSSVVMLTVIMLTDAFCTAMLTAVVLNFVVLSVIVLNVIMLMVLSTKVHLDARLNQSDFALRFQISIQPGSR